MKIKDFFAIGRTLINQLFCHNSYFLKMLENLFTELIGDNGESSRDLLPMHLPAEKSTLDSTRSEVSSSSIGNSTMKVISAFYMIR